MLSFLAQWEKMKIQWLILSTLLFTISNPAPIFPHGGHGDEFSTETEVIPLEGISINSHTAKTIGIKTQSVESDFLDQSIIVTGQIETQPNQTVAVRAPISGTIVELLAFPGDSVKVGQPLAVISSPELIQLQAESLDRKTAAEAALKTAKVNLKLAQENLERQKEIAKAQIVAGRIQVKTAEQRYQRELELTESGAFTRIDLLATEDNLAVAKSRLTEAMAQRDVIAAESEVRRAIANLEEAKINFELSDNNYRGRLQQLNTPSSEKGLVTVLAPITGRVSEAQITIGESFQDAGANLMTLVNNTQVWTTANIYEKDLEKIQIGQRVNIRIPSLPNQNFKGRITQISPIVEISNRVIPVRVIIDNHNNQLKPGMFAQLSIVTKKTSKPIKFIPQSAIVDIQGQEIVYLQNGNNLYQPIEVTFGQTFEDKIEVKKGLFVGDRVVVEGGIMLYAQSLRTNNVSSTHKEEANIEFISESNPNKNISWQWITLGGGVALITFFLGRISNNPKKKQDYLENIDDIYDIEEKETKKTEV